MRKYFPKLNCSSQVIIHISILRKGQLQRWQGWHYKRYKRLVRNSFPPTTTCLLFFTLDAHMLEFACHTLSHHRWSSSWQLNEVNREGWCFIEVRSFWILLSSYLFNIYPFLYIFSAIFPKITIPAPCSLRPRSLYKPRLLICGHPETLHVECSR